MADFYPVLARAISRLSTHNPQVRQEIYDHARGFLTTQLSGHGQTASAAEITRERIALETAIRRVEAQLQTGAPFNANASALALPSSGIFPRTERRVEASVRRECRNAAWPNRESQAGYSAKSAGPLAVGMVAGDVHQGPDLVIANNTNDANATPRNASEKAASRRRLLGRLKFQRAEAKQKRRNSKHIVRGEEFLEGKRSVVLDPTILGLAAIVAMLTFIVAISIPLAMIYFSRLMWFAEHLIEQPIVIIGILLCLGSTVTLVLLIFGTWRKNSRRRSSWLALPIIKRDALRNELSL
jgi:hypothetical protein